MKPVSQTYSIDLWLMDLLNLQVSDRQSYLVVSLVLCLLLGLLLCLQCCRSSTPSSPTNAAAHPKSNNYPSPKRYASLSLGPFIFISIFNLRKCSAAFELPGTFWIVSTLAFSE